MPEFEPRPYQRVAIERMANQRCCGLMLDPGAGKTAAVLEAFRRMRHDFEAERMLVITPLAVAYSTWPEQVQEWNQFRHLTVAILHGPRKAERLKLDADVYLINPEGVMWLAKQKWRLPDVLVVDESTKFKKPGTQRFRALRRMLGKFRRRYILTGTPAPNGLLDLFGQVYVVDQGRTLGRSMTAYKQEYFVPVPRGNYNDWLPRRNAMNDIRDRIAPIVLRIETDGLVGLPGLVTTPVRVRLPDKADRLYQRLRREMVVALEHGEVSAANAGALTNKCRQVANGRVYVDDRAEGLRYSKVHDAKEEALSRLVDELGGKPVIVVYEYKHDLEAIRDALGDVPAIGGGTKATEARELITKWNRGTLPVLAAHPASAGHGLNLQAGGHVMIWYSLTWNLEHYDQMVARLYRQGQKERVMVYQLIARGTVDETVARTLQAKHRDQRALLSALKEDLLWA